MKTIELNQAYSLDMGSLEPISVKVLEFLETGILCEYLGLWSGRKQVVSYDIFEMNGYDTTPQEHPPYQKKENKSEPTILKTKGVITWDKGIIYAPYIPIITATSINGEIIWYKNKWKNLLLKIKLLAFGYCAGT